MSLTLIGTQCRYKGARVFVENKTGAAEGMNYHASQGRAVLTFDPKLKPVKLKGIEHGEEESIQEAKEGSASGPGSKALRGGSQPPDAERW